jgi:hypothetical protein
MKVPKKHVYVLITLSTALVVINYGTRKVLTVHKHEAFQIMSGTTRDRSFHFRTYPRCFRMTNWSLSRCFDIQYDVLALKVDLKPKHLKQGKGDSSFQYYVHLSMLTYLPIPI